MATTEDGTLAIVPVTTSQNNKINSFNGHETALTQSTAGRLQLDLAALSGTQILTEAYSKNGHFYISGALAGAVTLNIDNDIKQIYLITDNSTGYNVTVQPTGGTGMVLPKKQTVMVRAQPTNMLFMLGHMNPIELAAITYAAAYQTVAARPLLMYKENAYKTHAGGMITLEGAVEETTTPPAVGDTIATLPVNCRPGVAVGFVCLADPATAATAQPVAIEIQTSGAIILRSLLGWTPLVNKPIDLSGIVFHVGG